MSTFRYRKVDAGTWGDERFKALSPDGKLLWFYLLTGPEVTSVPGLIVAGRAHLCEVLEWEVKRFDAAFAEFGQVDDEGTPMAKADWSARVIWLPKAWKHNRPSNVAAARSWLGHLSVVPGCALKREAIHVLAASIESFGEPYEVISRSIRERFANDSRTILNRSPDPVPDPVSVSSLERVQGEPAPLRSKGAFGLEVGAWADGIRSVTKAKFIAPTGKPANDLMAALAEHCPPDRDRCDFARAKGAEYSPLAAPGKLTAWGFIDWLNDPRPAAARGKPSIVQQPAGPGDYDWKTKVPNAASF